jgi:hypothetical protein
MNKPITDQAMREWTARAWEEAQAKGASMNREDIIRMAREAGYGWSLTDMHAPALERFAELVAEQEQKKWEEQTVVEIHEAVLEEREACAELMFEIGSAKLAAAIRARGQA